MSRNILVISAVSALVMLELGCAPAQNQLDTHNSVRSGLKSATLPLERHDTNFHVQSSIETPVTKQEAKNIALRFAGFSGPINGGEELTLRDIKDEYRRNLSQQELDDKLFVFVVNGYGGVMKATHHESTKETIRTKTRIFVRAKSGEVIKAIAY